jgi:hypothetical protein
MGSRGGWVSAIHRGDILPQSNMPGEHADRPIYRRFSVTESSSRRR